MDTNPPKPPDPLNPWALSNPNKKKKIQKIAGFFTKKTEEEVLKERKEADAHSAQVSLEAAQRATAIQQKLDRLVTKWKLPPRPNLIREPGQPGRACVVDIWVEGELNGFNYIQLNVFK